MTETDTESDADPSSRKPWLRRAGIAVGVIAAVKLALHLYASRRYGYFVDELYYLACARHLAWGYVDQPPLIALVAWLECALLGDSLSAIRFLPALSGAAKILLTSLIAREFGAAISRKGWPRCAFCWPPAYWPWIIFSA